MDQPFRRRRELLRSHLQEVEGEFVFAKSMISSNTEEIEEFLDESIKGRPATAYFKIVISFFKTSDKLPLFVRFSDLTFLPQYMWTLNLFFYWQFIPSPFTLNNPEIISYLDIAYGTHIANNKQQCLALFVCRCPGENEYLSSCKTP